MSGEVFAWEHGLTVEGQRMPRLSYNKTHDFGRRGRDHGGVVDSRALVLATDYAELQTAFDRCHAESVERWQGLIDAARISRALVAERDALQAKLDALREAAAHADVQYHLLLGKYDALDGKLDAVTKDAERYRFLRDEEAHRPFGRYPVIVGRFGQELDTAIDAAMQQRTALTEQGRAGEGRGDG